MTGTQITKVTVTPIAFPDPPLLNAVGVHQPWALRTIVEVHTGDGFVGLGESYGDAAHLELLRRAAAEIVGLDPFGLAELRQRIAGAIGTVDAADQHGLTGASSQAKTLLRVYSPFEVAFLDLQGQMIGRPVYDLLGGKVRDSVPFSAYLFYKWGAHPGAEPDEWGEALDPDGVVAQARAMISRYGFGSIKLKGGVFHPDQEIEAIQALRDAFGEYPLRLDPNCNWSVGTSVKVAEKTDGLLEYLEDPTASIPGMAEVAAQASMPLATNMCVVEFGHLPEAFATRAVGVVLSDHHYWGGLTLSMHLATVCQTWGVGVSMHSNSHLGISLAAMTHLGAAMPQLSYAADTHTPWQLGVDVLERPLIFVDGSVPVPDAPGLGVTLDRDALARLHENYVSCGITERDDTGYMRSIEPSYQARTPRW
ncbi:glucarate dehydratase family protein [Phytoactinopolyspora endophytica]|uniref:glucarate dehydratase family protein n=1 Tax=Phytoactinopolyspora endophytica TaxID=1642495 RepID=UPI00101D1464|nr:glucarate dehydratase family protein [Phytoactinopolyspora endophytica]